MPSTHRSHARLPLLLSLALAGCADYAVDSASRGWSSSAPSATSAATSATSSGGGSTAPPEQEEDLLLLPPAQTDVYVFVANPERNTVTRIDVSTQQVDTTEVGVRPDLVLTTDDYRQALVLNRGDDTVTVIEAPTLEKRTVPVRDNLNNMVLSPDGTWAVLWHDQAREEPDDPRAAGLQSFNEISFVHTETAAHFPMAVGPNPRMVRFTPDGATAVVVSDSLLARIDLTSLPLLPELIELAPGELDPPLAEEVLVAADGSFAWVRQFGATELLVVDLDSGVIDRVPAGVNPTDLDLSPDGRQAVALARGSDELWVYDARDPFAAPEVLDLPQTGYGSLLFDPTGDQAILYTTAARTERYGVWDRASDTITERSLVKPVAGMAITPTGGSLMVFHTLEDGPDTAPQFAGRSALTLVDLADLARTNPLLLPAEPLAYANSTTGELGYFVMDGSPYFEVLDYVTLLHDQYVLPSIPSFLGVLPDLDPGDADEPPAWVSQDHPLGRISFFDPDEGSLETLTGFELNSGIEEGE
ncbi:MAG: hypothetical protein R3F59_27215 [Myxococcota bacterium]